MDLDVFAINSSSRDRFWMRWPQLRGTLVTTFCQEYYNVARRMASLARKIVFNFR